MRISPTKGFPRHRSIAIIHKDRTIELENNSENPIYFISRDDANSLKFIGTLYKRENRINAWQSGDIKASILSRELSDISLAELCEIRDWVESYGATFGSPVSTSVSLLRATLDYPFKTAPGGPPLKSIVGGRTHTNIIGRYAYAEHWDISAAFGTVLSKMKPCGKWIYTEKLKDEGDQFLYCTVYVPAIAQWGPLPEIPVGKYWDAKPWDFPMHIIPYPQDKEITGIWTGDELRTAEEFGVKIIKIHQGWYLKAARRQPFAQWWDIMEDARNKPGLIGKWFKTCANSLWGAFSFKAGRGYKEWYSPDKEIHREPITDSPWALNRRDLAIGDTLHGRIRAKVFSEFIMPYSPNILMVLTDGGWILSEANLQGWGWKKKKIANDIVFIDPGNYLYYSSDSEYPVIYKTRQSVLDSAPDMKERMFLRSFHKELGVREENHMYRLPSPDKMTAIQLLRTTFPGSNITKYYINAKKPG